MNNNSMNNGAAYNNSNNEGGRFIMTSGTIKTMEVFAGTVKSIMEKVYGEGYSISVQSTTKNNNTRMTGINIRRKDINIAITIYLENFFTAYQDGMTMEEVCRQVKDIYERNKGVQDFDESILKDFNQAKDRICFKLINADKNTKLLGEVPYLPYQDLAIVFYVLVEKSIQGTGSVLVRNQHLDMWGVDTKTIYSLAMENTQRIFRGNIQSMDSVITEIMEQMLDEKDAKEYYDMPAVTADTVPMYVASNYDRFNGASVVLYPNLLKDFAEKIGDNFYILPSSVHELIFVPESECVDSDYMKMMVQEINVTQVEDEEVLSDNIYFYDRAYDRVVLL